MQAVLTKPALDSDAKKVVAVLAAPPAGALAAKVAWDRFSDRPDPRRFRLREGEPVPDGVMRLAGGQLDLSIERLEGRTDEDLGTAVHEARKSLKRLRAIVRLARDELGDDVYRRENTAFRDAGRRLAGARDSQVLLETLDGLSERYSREAPLGALRWLEKDIEEQHAAAQRRLEDGVDVAAVLTELRRARPRAGLAAGTGSA